MSSGLDSLLYFGLVFVALSLASLNLRTFGGSVIFSVAVLGKHSKIKKLGADGLFYWLGTVLVMAPFMLILSLGFGLMNEFMSDGWFRMMQYVVSSLALTWAIFNFYVFKVGPRRDSEGALRQRMINMTRLAGTLKGNVGSGVLNGVSLIVSEGGLIAAVIWLLVVTSLAQWWLVLALALWVSSAIWWVFGSLVYGSRLHLVERFRKSYGPKISFLCGVGALFISWLILVRVLGLL